MIIYEIKKNILFNVGKNKFLIRLYKLLRTYIVV